ncbi:hypothetical protein [Paraburkholderia sp. BR10882]|uniref:hypothetical protein n=1 Tax=unclassified Paraburkholderia TaxID=2615204 RepID=UPI0034CFCF28
MREAHHFTMKHPFETTPMLMKMPTGAIIWPQPTVREDERMIDQWVKDNDLRDFVKTPLVEHKGKNGMWGFELPTYTFFRDADAVAFKLVFGDKFEYSVYDTDDF